MPVSSQIARSDLIDAANIPAVFKKCVQQQWPDVFISAPAHKQLARETNQIVSDQNTYVFLERFGKN